jgi:hypothetical protein
VTYLLVFGLGFVALTTAIAATAEFILRRRRDERGRMSRPGGFRRWVESVREEARIQVTRLTDRQQRAKRFAECLMKGSEALREAVLRGKVKSLAWIAAGAVGFTALWGLAVKTEIGVDSRSFHGLGYSNGMAFSLALLTTLVFCVLGIVVSDLVGLTHLLPGIGTTSATMRVALVGTVMLLFVGAVSQLPRLAEYRSAPIAAEVQDAQNAQQALTLLPTSQRPAVVVEQADKKLAEAKNRLATARYVDKRLAVGAAALEAATSWAAAWSLLLVTYLLIGVFVAGANWRAGAAGAAIRETNQRFYARVARRAEQMEIEPAEVEAILSEAQTVVPPQRAQQDPPPASPDEPPAVPLQDAPARPPGVPGASVAPLHEPEPEPIEPTPSWNAF